MKPFFVFMFYYFNSSSVKRDNNNNNNNNNKGRGGGGGHLETIEMASLGFIVLLELILDVVVQRQCESYVHYTCVIY